MKKNLFLFAIIAGVSFPAAQAGLRVSADTGVKVSKSTLLYVDGNVNMDNYSSGAAQKLSNEGYVEITKGFTNNNSETNRKNGANFVNEYKPNSHYGQLIIDNGASVAGQIQGDLKLIDAFAYHPIAFPYTGYTYSDVIRDAFNGSAQYYGYTAGRNGYSGRAYDGDRYKNPLFLNNNNNQIYDHVANNATLSPGLSYGLNIFDDGKNTNIADKTRLTSYYGTPNNGNVSISVNAYEVGLNSQSNAYGEAWGSYISDFTLTIPTGWDSNIRPNSNVDGGTFGDNIFWLGNPFTSNIKLSNESTFLASGVSAIYQPISSVYTREDGNGDAVEGNGSLVWTADNTGDASALIVRPYHTFHVKTTGSKIFNFTQAMKTFTFTETDVPNTVLNKGINNSKVYQVGMDLYDSNTNTGNRFYVVAGDIYQPEAKGEGIEIYNHNFNDSYIGVYTLQEKEDGSVAENLIQNKTYINGVNMNYVGKPIHIVFNAPNGGTFTFKPRLNENLTKSKYSFYFEDKEEGVVKKVDENFEYSFNAKGNVNDRFVMYWMETPANLNLDEIKEVEVAQTIIFKDADQYKVRFNSKWKKADVYIYNINGQLLRSDRGINTASDYHLNLDDSIGVYVVKTVSENGKTVTKKIIK